MEGTRFTEEKKDKLNSPYKNLLVTKAGGIAFVLASMGDQLQSIVDVTIIYPNGNKSFWDFLCGKVKDIKVQVTSHPITIIPKGDYINDEDYRKNFHQWLNSMWAKKDRYIEETLEQNRQQSANAV